MNPNIYEAALDLGATPMQALWKVIVPEIRPGMISGFMLALTLSIDDFAVTVFTIGNQGLETLSTYIYADARKGGLTLNFVRFRLSFCRGAGVVGWHQLSGRKSEEKD